MKIIYIAGPYRGKGEWDVKENIIKAERAALFVWQRGGVALCPHKNTAFFGGAPGCSDETWLEGDLEMLRRCDAVWAIERYYNSKGARGEIKLAKELGKPVLYSANEVIHYIEETKNIASPEGGEK